MKPNPLECISQVSVKGQQWERTGLFFLQCFNKKTKFFHESICVMSLLVLPAQWQEADSFVWEGNTSLRQPHWALWVFPLNTRITYSHGQLPLLGHPQFHPWQPTPPPHTPQSPRWQRVVVLGFNCRVWGSRPVSRQPFSRLRTQLSWGSRTKPKLSSILVQDNKWAKTYPGPLPSDLTLFKKVQKSS